MSDPPDPERSSPSLLAELKRRNVLKVGGSYAVAAWLLLQVAAVLFPAFAIASWAMRLLFGLLVTGFPVALVLAWVFELTPEGVRRTGAPDSEPAWSPADMKRRTHVLAAAVVVAFLAGLGILGWRRTRAPADEGGPTAMAETPASPSPASGRLPVPLVSSEAIPDGSIAVLPFENLSADRNNAYFAEGMQEEILTRLANLGDLKVISRTSTERYRSRPPDLKTVGRELGVASVLEGSVQKAGDRVRVNVQLIDTRSDTHLWAQTYDRTLDDVFTVESDVAERIARSLKGALLPDETRRLEAVPTASASAYDEYLRGEYYLNRASANLSGAEFDSAVVHYRAATEADPEFGLGFARLAYARLLQLHFLGGGDADLAGEARSAVNRALELGADLAEAHLAQGFYADYVLHDLDQALSAFQRARELKPQSAEAIFATGVVQFHRARPDSAIDAFSRAVELAPTNSLWMLQLAQAHASERDYATAERTARRVVAMDPESAAAYSTVAALVYARTGSPDAALAVLETAPAAVRDEPFLLSTRAGYQTDRRRFDVADSLLARVPSDFGPPGLLQSLRGNVEWYAGRREEARRHFEEAAAAFRPALQARPRGDTPQQGDLALVELRLGRRDEALRLAELGARLRPVEKDAATGVQAQLSLALVYADLGRSPDAVAILRRLLSLPSGWYLRVSDLEVNPVWDPLRDDPGFQDLLKERGHG